MAGTSHTHSSLLAALDGPHLDDPPSGPSTSSYSPTMGMHNNTRFDNAMDTSADTAEAARQALKRKLDAVAPITQASRFAPMFSPQRNVRRRVEDSRHAEFAQASASAISMLGYGDSSPMRGLSPTRSSRSVRRAPGEEDDTPVRAPPGTSMFEFALHYDTESAVRTMDVGGHDQEQKMEEFIHKSLKDMNHGRTVEEGMKVLGMSSMKDVIPGMNVRLLRHQVVGVSWMLDQERSKYRGGILADDMGLGKTVQMIATMVMNPPDEESDVRTTLIVLPTALLQQWKDELENKTNGMFDVHIHHGTKKIKKLQDMKAKDVILTTYHTLAGECTIGSDVEEAEEVAWVQKNGGLLARMHWYRVVVDEAQFIRNRKTFSSRAVAMLRSQYRWCLTGTPVTNTLVDVWAFLRFGRFRPWNDWKDFDAQVGRVMAQDPALAGMRTQEILNPVMMRRQKNAKEVDGRPLVELPSKEIEIVHLDFSKEEREIYDSMERKARIRVNRFIKRGTLLKNHHYVLVLILRLRQASCHPFLLSDENGNIGDPSMIVGSEMDKELARAQRLMPAQWIKDVQARFMLRKQAEEFDFPDDAEIPEDTCPVCIDVMTEDSGRVLECGHEMCHECLMDLNKSALQTTGEVRHSEQDEKLWEAAAAKGHRPCPKCHKMVSLAPDHVFRSYAFIPDEEDVERAIKKRKQVQRKQRQAKKGAKKKTTFMEIDDSDDEIEIQDAKKGASNGQLPTLDSDDEDMPDMFDLIAAANREKKPTVKDEKKEKKPKEEDNVDMSDDEQGDARAERNMDQAFYNNSITTYSKSGQSLAPSTKMIYMIDKLKEWDACGDKTIVYSQWTSYLDLIEDLFLRHGIRSLRYDGRMGREAREMTLKQFREPGGPKVICISIKCGGVGLNLVSANRVINLDLSWNYATESQAYDRVHRMGQEKDVTIKRLVIKDTLEERMLRLQDLKTSLSDAALGEGTGMKLHKLSVKEIKTLFGFQNVQSSQDRDQNRDP